MLTGVTGKVILQRLGQLVGADWVGMTQKSHRLQGHPEDRQSGNGARHDAAGCTKRYDWPELTNVRLPRRAPLVSQYVTHAIAER